MTWDEWRGTMDGQPVLWVKHLWCRRGFHIDLHKMIAADPPLCFHTHPAWAIRAVLWGGYVDQSEGPIQCRWSTFKPGRIGVISPRLSHRIDRLLNGRTSYSLWIRFRKCAPIELRGEGWKAMDQTYRAPGTVLVK